MTTEASQFIAEAVKRVKMDGDFAPSEIGKRLGMSKMQSDILARSLSDAGVLVIGFDAVAHFSPEFRKMTEDAAVAANKIEGKPVKKAKGIRSSSRRAVAAV